MRLFKATYKDREGEIRTAAKWYVEFRDHMGCRRRLAAFTDKKASVEFGRKMDALVICRLAGERPDGDLGRWLESLPSPTCDKLVSLDILDKQRAAGAKSLLSHLADWRNALAAKGDSSQHVRESASRVEVVLRGCGLTYFSEIVPSTVQNYLAGLRQADGGISAQTLNHYLGAMKQFCRWMVAEGRAQRSPIAHLPGLNVRTDRRHDRRALTVKETQQLLAATHNGPTLRGMAGRDREMLYRLALETGLRWSELRSLTRQSFDLEGNPPTVTVKAAYSKHRREDKLPLRETTAVLLRDYLADKLPLAGAFDMPCGGVGAKVLRVDLEAAGISYQDADGLLADFHALRHTFITNLADSGVHPSVARRLARHSDVNLTLSRYTHSTLQGLGDAVESLPDISPQSEVAKATGTEGAVVLGSCLAKQERFSQTKDDQSGQAKNSGRKGVNRRKPLQIQAKTPVEAVEEVVRAEGFEPSAYGLKVSIGGKTGTNAQVSFGPPHTT